MNVKQLIFIIISMILIISSILYLLENSIQNTIEHNITSSLKTIDEDLVKDIDVSFLYQSNKLIVSKNKIYITGDTIDENVCVRILFHKERINNKNITFKENIDKYINHCELYIKAKKVNENTPLIISPI
jgi:hypothetical protein